MRIQAQWLPPFSVLLLGLALFYSTGCHPTRTPPRHGCFNPVPAQPVQELRQWRHQLRWPSAHSGNSGVGPENRLQAIIASARRGLPLLEIDVPRDSKEHLTSYADAVKAVRGYPTALALDLKGESSHLVSQAIEIARSLGAEKQIVVRCQSIETARFVRNSYPGIAILSRCNIPDDVYEALKLQPVPEIIHVDFAWSSEGLLENIHEAGSAVFMNSVEQGEDNPKRWKELMDLGVDIVRTAYPETFTRSIPRACSAK